MVLVAAIPAELRQASSSTHTLPAPATVCEERGRAAPRRAATLRVASLSRTRPAPGRADRHALMEFRGQQEEPVEEEEGEEGMGASSAPPPLLEPAPEARYHECLRNHAAALGGHVVDGCGEFMPSAAAGDDALRCAACGCHRSFHRKGDAQQQQQQRCSQLLLQAPAQAATPPRVPLLLPPPHPHPHHPYAAAAHPHYAPPFPAYHHGTPSGSGGTTTESSSEERGPPSAHAAAPQPRRKRFRTKFTPEQKEQMLAFAERLGWRMQKQDEALVQQFCDQAGVRRQVFKVWMHNNKHAGRRQQQQQPQLLPPPQEQQQTQQQQRQEQ